jgi:hypothetical protein
MFEGFVTESIDVGETTIFLRRARRVTKDLGIA